MKKFFKRFCIRLFVSAAGAALLVSAAGKNPAASAWLSEKLCTSIDIETLFSIFR